MEITVTVAVKNGETTHSRVMVTQDGPWTPSPTPPKRLRSLALRKAKAAIEALVPDA